ncbi:hypothetical protein CKY39_19740 [Variovorax boronicumulans]|uniref:Uncharacterized protein n=1 Tax=Variovorax boronicumulans TaxID=436515 RepID=A0A250DLE6_9BURK|nr:hypothetical protein [Variovorax boronicumulans]ATA55196.1 hypothetical protein CKY39_19740 [Variovorax boronicumulans]
MDEAFLRRHDEARQKAGAAALHETLSMGLPRSIAYSQSFGSLGATNVKVVLSTTEALLKKHGDELPYVLAAAVRDSWFANWSGACYMTFAQLGTMEIGSGDWSGELFGEFEGWAFALYNELSNVDRAPERAKLLADLPLKAPPDNSSILLAMAISWFNKAATEIAAGRLERGLNWLAEAHEALVLERGDEMWNAGVAHANEAAGQQAMISARSALARTAAAARHAENRAFKQDVFSWCDKNMGKFKSMDAAAEAIAGKVVSVTFRTARDWIAEWKKLRSAGTA